MDFVLEFGGSPGDVVASLVEGGAIIATANGLKDAEAARKWGRKAARDHKVTNTPDASHYESVNIQGESTFSL